MPKGLLSQYHKLVEHTGKVAKLSDLRQVGGAIFRGGESLDDRPQEYIPDGRSSDCGRIQSRQKESGPALLTGELAEPHTFRASPIQRGDVKMSRHHFEKRRSACNCVLANEAMKPVQPAQPGTVSPYTHHVMLRIPQPSGHEPKDSSIWWPPVMEKHAALVQAFAAVAEMKAQIAGNVKVTAYEHMDPRDRSGDQNKVDMLLFPEGWYYSKVPYDKIKEIVKHHIQDYPDETSTDLALPSLGQKSSRGDFKGIGLFICTHMSRDTRCGKLGFQLAKRLQELIDERGYESVRIYQVSHVGGHKYAGNVLVYGGISPCDGDWFGGVNKFNAERFLDSLVKMEVGSEGGVDDPYLRQFWRGRMNTTKEDQIQMFENPAILEEQDSEDEGHETDSESSSSGSSSSSSDSDSVRLALQ